MTARMISPTKLAERWGLGESALAEQRRRGVGPAWHREGRRIFYAMADVLEFERRRDASAVEVLDDKLLRIGDVAEIAGFSRSSIVRMAERGDFPPPVRINRNLRWSRREVLRWIAEVQAA